MHEYGTDYLVVIAGRAGVPSAQRSHPSYGRTYDSIRRGCHTTYAQEMQSQRRVDRWRALRRLQYSVGQGNAA